jgi:hypothetical protein
LMERISLWATPRKQKEVVMGDRLSGSIIIAVAAAAASTVVATPVTQAFAQTRAATGAVLKTSWGEPDLQGIWTDEFDTALQRPAQLANQEFFTEAQRAELDKTRSATLNRFATEREINGAYNRATFRSTKRTGARTSKIVDPPNGRLPPLTAEAHKTAATDRAFRLALLQSTGTCKDKLPACAGGHYEPAASPRRAEAAPHYNTVRINRNDGPEDSSLPERCLTGGLPEFGIDTGSFRRIVQTPGGISMYYDVGQGQGWQRNIVMDGSSHLPPGIRQWFGDSRGHWEGNTLVVDVTNFSPMPSGRGRTCTSSSAGRPPGRRRSPTRPPSRIRRCGTGLGPSSRSSASKATRRTGFIPNHAALKATTDSRDFCMEGAWKRPLLQKAEVPILPP